MRWHRPCWERDARGHRTGNYGRCARCSRAALSEWCETTRDCAPDDMAIWRPECDECRATTERSAGR